MGPDCNAAQNSYECDSASSCATLGVVLAHIPCEISEAHLSTFNVLPQLLIDVSIHLDRFSININEIQSISINSVSFN